MTNIDKIQYDLFLVFIYFSYIITALVITGISNNAEFYLEQLNYYVKIYISLYLILRFNRFRRVKFTDLDRMVVFSSGMFLFSTTIFHTIIMNYLNQIKGYLNSLFNKK